MSKTMIGKTVLAFTASVAVAAAANAAFKPAGAIEHTVKDANVGESCFKSGAHWGDGTDDTHPNGDHDYYSSGSAKQVVMTGTFPGRSLWLEGWECAKSVDNSTITINDLHLYNAAFTYFSFPYAFAGGITVHGGATSQFRLGASSASTFRLSANMKSEGEGALFQIARESNRGNVYPVPVTGDWSEWNGELRVGADVNMSLQNTGCPGAIFVMAGARFTALPSANMSIGVFSNAVDAVAVAFVAPAGGTVSVGDFRANDVTVVTNTASGLSCGLFKVTSSYTPGPNPLKVRRRSAGMRPGHDLRGAQTAACPLRPRRFRRRDARRLRRRLSAHVGQLRLACGVRR